MDPLVDFIHTIRQVPRCQDVKLTHDYTDMYATTNKCLYLIFLEMVPPLWFVFAVRTKATLKISYTCDDLQSL